MKFFGAILFIFFVTSLSFAARPRWTACPSLPQAEPIENILIKSNQMFGPSPMKAFVWAICREGIVLSKEDWIQELRFRLNPTWSVSSFNAITQAGELEQVLSKGGIRLHDPAELTKTVKNFLRVENSVVLVGTAKTQAVVLAASSNGKRQSASLIQINQKSDAKASN